MGLLAVNPYEWLTYLTTQDMIDLYKKAQDSGDLLKTPHPFAVSSRAYVRMVTRMKPQSLMYKDGAILGSWMETYLLEKSRVIMQGPAERNYHIFYFMFKGLDKAKVDGMGLTKPMDYWYLKQGGAADVDGIDDKECFDGLMESLKLFRFSDGDLN